MVAFENPSHATERLVAAAAACIERDGIDAVTTRAIAREAGMNVAAVNYYFASKDALLEVALERALEAMLTPTFSPDALSTLAAKRDPRGALFDAVDDMLATSARQPRSVFAQLKGPIADQDYSAAVVARMNRYLERVFDQVSHALAGDGDAEKRLVLVQMWSAALLGCLLPELFRQFARLDVGDERKRRAFVETLVRTALRRAKRGRMTKKKRSSRRSAT